MRGVELPKPARRTRYVTDDEYAAVYARASERIRIAMDLALLTGLRRGDILALTREAITPEGLLVHTGKTGKSLLIEITPAMEAVLARARALAPQLPGRFLVRTRKGGRYTDSGFSAVWQRLVLRAGVERFCFHDIRAKSASDTQDIAAAAARLGHASPEITRRVYVRSPQKVRPLR